VQPTSFRVAPGEVLTLLGESGSGKSLLAKAILGTLPANLTVQGAVTILDRHYDAADVVARRTLWGRAIALLPQEPWLALDPTMRIAEQLSETHVHVGGEPRAFADAAAQKDLTEARLGTAGDAYPHMLSGGMAQRVAFAAARAGRAPVLVVDEPTKGLDAPLREQVIRQLHAVKASGGSVLTITHDVHVARALGGTIAVMLDGRIVEQGAAADVLGAPRHDYTKRLLAAAPESWPLRAAPARADSAPLLRARDLAKRYGTRTLFEGIDLDIRAHDRIAISGPSGSGKTTLGNILLGLVAPDAGTVKRDAAIGRTDFQKLYQDPISAFPPEATLRQSLNDLVRLHRLDWAEARAWMTRLSLDGALLDRRPREISSGELQRFAVLRILLLKPKLVFADEPTSRLDPLSQKNTFEVLCEMIDSVGAALILVTHDRDIARSINGAIVSLAG
jgi:peptide/nickel transport system ATP-binding protein